MEIMPPAVRKAYDRINKTRFLTMIIGLLLSFGIIMLSAGPEKLFTGNVTMIIAVVIAALFMAGILQGNVHMIWKYKKIARIITSCRYKILSVLLCVVMLLPIAFVFFIGVCTGPFYMIADLIHFIALKPLIYKSDYLHLYNFYDKPENRDEYIQPEAVYMDSVPLPEIRDTDEKYDPYSAHMNQSSDETDPEDHDAGIISCEMEGTLTPITPEEVERTQKKFDNALKTIEELHHMRASGFISREEFDKAYNEVYALLEKNKNGELSNSLLEQELKALLNIPMKNTNNNFYVQQTVSSGNTPDDVMEKLRIAKEMLDSGLITEEDYNNKKEELLKRI